MKYYSIVLLSLLFLNICYASSKFDAISYYPDQLIIKLKNTEQINLDLEKFTKILSSSNIAIANIEPLLRPSLVQGYQKAIEKNTQIQPFAIQRLEQLKLYYKLTFTAPYNIEYLAKLISAVQTVEYVEPVPKRWIIAEANDPLLSEQYYLDQIHAKEAWDLLPSTSDSVVVAIIDTGADLDHEDLRDKIFLNSGEIGTDQLGQDKRTNGIDDDGNGFIDDWRGWDFYSNDNTPVPGNPHGTHVAGIIGAIVNNEKGIAGINPKAKLLILKIGPDNPFSTTVANGYEAMVYAAMMGARVINCSWGGPTRSRSEQEIIDIVTANGVLVVAAAGNEGIQQTFYPAGYDGVIAVGAVNQNDRRAYFSNYGYFIDVMAPGSNILSTVPNNGYEYQSGTSMAAPVAAGVASLIALQFPHYSPLQLGEHLKITADSIDHLQPNYRGLLGYGRVNAYTALSISYPQSMILQDYSISDQNNDNVIEKGETFALTLQVLNVLNPIRKGKILVLSENSLPTNPPQYDLSIGELETLESRSIQEPLLFEMSPNVPNNYTYTMQILFLDGEKTVGRSYIQFVVNPTYRTLHENDIAVTVNDRGNIAYNDYPNNLQGEGFRYKGGRSILFEGAVMIGVSPQRLSNVARGADQMRQDDSFVPQQPVSVVFDNNNREAVAISMYQDQGAIDQVGVSVLQHTIEPLDSLVRNAVILSYTVQNQNSITLDSLFTGLYFDWDIGLSGQGDYCEWQDEQMYAFIQNTIEDSLPVIGLTLLSKQPMNFFAIDNNGSSPSNPGVYDGYTRNEKWQTMTSGIQRKRSSITDISCVISGGPVQLLPGESEEFIFGIVAGYTKEEVERSIQRLREYLANKGVDVQLPPNTVAQKVEYEFYPNPVDAQHNPTLVLKLPDSFYVKIDLYTVTGVKVQSFLDEYLPAGEHVLELPFSNTVGLSSAQYFLQITIRGGARYVLPVVIFH